MEYDEKSRTAICLECGDSIVYGRQDKKFCCETCKNRYNNRKTRRIRAMKSKIMSALEKNYRILEDLLKMNATEVSVQQLRQLGFNFDYVTSYHKVRRHDEYCCFDICITVMSARVMSISRVFPARKYGESRKLSLNLPDIPQGEK